MSTALYRRYRPETFADVIGQEHVTEPLMSALRKNRVSHAYLFSGPRGCGKTTSARILARCLNCAQGPTDVPCGHCDSCVELARDGSGSLDVIEIDAASHGGVEDARDLRERATFAPVRDRYKIFIIDEAHMVTSAGFNALLKIVEEPPEHIKFIFATTEPDKVIGTIRSRTHHYPFRLVPPEPLIDYLGRLCEQEHVPVAPGVLSLVIRAGGGSVRDSLSVLDQLMAGANAAGLDYEMAVSLLGYTHASLLDDVVDAVAAADAGTVFRAVDRVIQTGHDPRRFVEDLLERFRDLIIVNAMPDSVNAILRGTPEDQIARLHNQANHLGSAELSRAADVTNAALTEMTGATSPRLHLELLCARILLPGADQSERGVAARVDRLERRLSYSDGTTTAVPALDDRLQSAPAQSPPAQSPPAQSAPAQSAPVSGSGRTIQASPAKHPVETPLEPERHLAGRAPTARTAPDQGPPAPTPRGPGRPAAAQGEHGPSSAPDRPDTSTDPEAAAADIPQAPTVDVPAAPAASRPSGDGVDMLRRAWPEILDEVSKIRKMTWIMVKDNAQVRNFDGSVLELAFDTPGRADSFGKSGHPENVSSAISKVLGLTCVIKPVVDTAPTAGESGPKVPANLPAPADGTAGWAGVPGGGTPPYDNTASGNTNGAANGVVPRAGAALGAEPHDSRANGSSRDFAGATAWEGHGPGKPIVPDTVGRATASAGATSAGAAAAGAAPDVPGSGTAAAGGASARGRVAAAAGFAVSSDTGLLQGDGVDDRWEESRTPARAENRSVNRDNEPPVMTEEPPVEDGWVPPLDEPEPGPDEGPSYRGPMPDADQGQVQPGGPSHPAPSAPMPPQPGGSVPIPGTAAGPIPGTAAGPTPGSTPGPTAGTAAGEHARPLRRYEQLLQSAAAAPGANGSRSLDLKQIEDIPSADDETIEESGLVGRAAVERILGGRLIEEHGPDGP